AQDNSTHVHEFARLFQVHQSAIHLPRLHSAIFQNKNRIIGFQIPLRSDGRFHKSQAPAKHPPMRFAGTESFSLEVQRPAALRIL
ncbi:MAG: hypothetical protein QOJ41_1148, partial [Acidobacteriaceae bacterium]|nr:hypothetical protein [Acidobacteriaceae bacterium]